jgi:hypothetical protein
VSVDQLVGLARALGAAIRGGELHVLAQPIGDAATFDEESQDLRRASAQQPSIGRPPIAYIEPTADCVAPGHIAQS